MATVRIAYWTLRDCIVDLPVRTLRWTLAMSAVHVHVAPKDRVCAHGQVPIRQLGPFT